MSCGRLGCPVTGVNAVIVLHDERREIEITYDELKTHMLERRESLRSRSRGGVRQEICAFSSRST